MPRYVKEAGSTGTLEQKNNTTQHKYEIDMDNKVGNTIIVTFSLDLEEQVRPTCKAVHFLIQISTVHKLTDTLPLLL